MKCFLDTSVLVAACWTGHTGHEPSLELVAAATRESWACGIHTLAEMYATLTALPVRPAVSPEQAVQLVQEAERRLTTIALSPVEYLNVIRHAGGAGARSGMVYDALLLQCARKFDARRIYTWNQKHFQRLAPDLANRIRTP